MPVSKPSDWRRVVKRRTQITDNDIVADAMADIDAEYEALVASEALVSA